MPDLSHWRWRMSMAEAMAQACDFDSLGIRAIYVIGSTKDGTAGPGSDIDLLVHYDGSLAHRDRIASYLEGWGRCLAEWNFERTGQRAEKLVDLHLITDDDIRKQTSFACMIGAVDNSARLVRKAAPEEHG